MFLPTTPSPSLPLFLFLFLHSSISYLPVSMRASGSYAQRGDAKPQGQAEVLFAPGMHTVAFACRNGTRKHGEKNMKRELPSERSNKRTGTRAGKAHAENPKPHQERAGECMYTRTHMESSLSEVRKPSFSSLLPLFGLIRRYKRDM